MLYWPSLGLLQHLITMSCFLWNLMEMFIPFSGSSSDDGVLPSDTSWPLCWPSQERRRLALYWYPCWAFTEGTHIGTLLSPCVKFWVFSLSHVNVYLCFYRNEYTGNRWSWCYKPMSSLFLTRPWVTFEPGCADRPPYLFISLAVKKKAHVSVAVSALFSVMLAVALFQPVAFPQRSSAAKCHGADQTQPNWEPGNACQSRSCHCPADIDQQSGTRFGFKKKRKPYKLQMIML